MRYLFFCLFFVVSFGVFGQDTFLKTFDFAGNWEEATGVVRANGGYIIVGGGGLAGSNSLYAVRLLKVDEEGNELWRKLYVKDYVSWGTSQAGLIRSSDGNYVFTGGHRDTIDYTWHGLYGKFDENGDTLWLKVDPWEQSTNIIGVTEAADGGYLFTGRAVDTLNLSVQLYLLRTDIDGNVIWFRTYGGLGYDMGIWSANTPDGGFITGGFYGSNPSQSSDGWLLRVDAEGEVVWSKTYGGVNNDCGVAIRSLGGDTYLMNHCIDSIASGSSVSQIYRYISKIDGNGNTLWKSYYAENHPWSPETASLRILEDGSAVIVGRIVRLGWGQGVWVIKFSAEGQELWHRNYLTVNGNEENKYAIDFTKAHDGGLVLVGRIGDGGDDMMVLKLDSMGCFTSGCDSVATSSETLFGDEGGLVVYPSPFEEEFRLEGLVPFGKEGRVVVRDMLGRVLLDGGLVRGKFMEEVDSSSWGEGLYVVSLFVEGRVLFSRKVLKR